MRPRRPGEDSEPVDPALVTSLGLLPDSGGEADARHRLPAERGGALTGSGAAASAAAPPRAPQKVSSHFAALAGLKRG